MSIVIVGSCMIDFISYVPRLPKPGETLQGSKFKRTVGGKGANQCVAAAKLGASTTLVASLGSDVFADEYLEILKSMDIETKYVKKQADISSGIAQICVADSGENSIVIIVGANALLSPPDVDDAREAIERASVLLTQFETPLETTLHALKLHQDHGVSIVNGAPAVANVSPELFKLCDIFCVNETEAEIMTGIEPLTLENVQKVLDKFFELGCNTVIITLGSNGAVFATKTDPEMIHVPTAPIDPVDTTGAGDAFLGALAYFMAHHGNLSLEEQIKRACKVATKSVLRPGTQTSFPERNELPDELFK